MKQTCNCGGCRINKTVKRENRVVCWYSECASCARVFIIKALTPDFPARAIQRNFKINRLGYFKPAQFVIVPTYQSE